MTLKAHTNLGQSLRNPFVTSKRERGRITCRMDGSYSQLAGELGNDLFRVPLSDCEHSTACFDRTAQLRKRSKERIGSIPRRGAAREYGRVKHKQG
jgi:hypothetical protein